MSLGIEKLPRYRNRAMASFIVDDVYGVMAQDADAYKRFSEWAESAGVRGELSAILGIMRDESGRALPPHPAWTAEVARASTKHLDAFMEVMTHRFLYDFAADRMRTDGPHEGVWMLDAARESAEYLAYFQGIAKRAHAAGIRHSGLTIPGCGCAPCVDFKKRNHMRVEAGRFNPEVYRALLQMLKESVFASPVFGLFVGTTDAGPADVQLMLEDGPHAIYDVPPGVRGDHFGRWDNLPEFLDLDQYISAGGARGRLPELLAQQTRTLVYYGHWQSLRPDSGIGFSGFQEVAARLAKHYGNEIVWMRPTEIATYRHTERHTQLRTEPGGRAFSLSIPFAPLHELSLRVQGSASVRLRAPSGKELAPSEKLPGEACAIFNLLPENGRYEVLGG